MLRCLVVVIVLSGVANAGPKRVIHQLTESEATVELAAFHLQARVPRVVAATPILTAQINAAIAADANILGAAQLTTTLEVHCTSGVMTDAFVSWTCIGTVGGDAPMRADSAWFVEGEDLRNAKVEAALGAEVVKKAATLPGKRDDQACTVDPKLPYSVDDEGVTFASLEERCTLGWDVLLPLLPKDAVLRRVVGPGADAQPALDDPKAGWAKSSPRFTAQGDVVVDHATDLTWASRDNGADLDYAAAVKFAATFKAGGFADWRLPTEEELEVLSDPALGHREKTDCTKGKNALLVTPLIKLSCGLAWTSSKAKAGMVGFGFISGTPRVSKATEKKNYRALLVRGK